MNPDHDIEFSLVILKPDVVQERHGGDIIHRIERIGKICAIKVQHLTDELLNQHYSHIAERDFFPHVKETMMSGPVWVLLVRGHAEFVHRFRTLLGPTNPVDAPKKSIRAIYGKDITRNAVHASDSMESAAIETARFFTREELVVLAPDLVDRVYPPLSCEESIDMELKSD